LRKCKAEGVELLPCIEAKTDAFISRHLQSDEQFISLLREQLQSG
jgi:hypothetical protein